MFTKSLVPQSLVDATRAIMEADEKKKMLLEPELDETGFHKAAHAAKRAGQSHFEFQGKKYPVTAKHHSEGMVPVEKIQGQIAKKKDDKAAATGHTADVREEDEKKSSNPFDVLKGKYKSQLAKKPGELTGHEHKKTSTGDVFTKKAVKEESHPDEKEDKALVKKMVKPSALKKEEEKETHLSKHSMTEEGDCVTEPRAKKIADKEVGKHEKKMHHKEGVTFKSFKEQLIERSHSEKQARTMAAAAHNPSFAKKVGIPQDVAKDFNKADKGTKQLSKAMSHKESIGGISTMSEEDDVRIEPNENMKSKTVDTIKGREKVSADYHNKPLSYKVKLNVEEKTSPMEVAKELARKSFKKIRNETMMGKLGTSEEKKHD
jgi:hypothetical protein